MTNTIEETVDLSGSASEEEFIRWTLQADGSYAKEGDLPADTPAVRIFEIDEDYETNPHAVCAGQKLWPREEAVALVEGKIAEGSYRAWRYEIRPEIPNSQNALGPVVAVPTQPAEPRTCSNSSCKKGPEGTRGIVTRRNAKYCCPSCRVSACRREKPKPAPTEMPRRKPRCDRKYPSQAARQRAYDYRRWGTVRDRRAIDKLLGKKSRRESVNRGYPSEVGANSHIFRS